MREDSLRGVTSNPAIFEKAILGSTDYDEQIARAGRARGSTPAQIYEEIAITDVQLGLRRAAPGLGRGRRRRRLRVARGRARLRARHRRHARAGARLLGARRPPQPDDQDPRHRRGRAGDRGGDRRGHQRQRDAAVLASSPTRPSPRPTSAAWSGASRRASRSDVHSVASFFVSRVDTEVDKRLPSCGREDLRGIAAIANARAAYMQLQGALPGRALRARCARPAARCSGRSGPRPASRTRATRRPSTSIRWSPRTRSTRCRCPRCSPARSSSRSRGATADQDPSAELDALADAGIDMGDVTEKLLRDGHREVRRAVRQADRGRRADPRGRSSPAARRRSSPRSPTSSSRR